ncbi:MAG: alpha-ribazole phosphatase [Acidaminococcaceae bacterium]|nr:alpha-ribazole phosphatase [Acidaminococcaceae bacterium]MBR1661349.1 alpha-ribazole phosphatase [Acidaminococcaceae bacterium]
MAKLYLVRHGETDYNNTYRFQGQTDIALNEKGIRQAEKLAQYFHEIPLDAIYTSSLQRARKTAEIIGNAKNLKPIATDALREMSFGIWENMNSEVIQKKYAKEWKDFFANPASVTIPQGESMGAVQKRAYPEVKQILDRYPEGNLVFVAHGGIIRVLMCTMLGLDLNRAWHLHVGNASVTCFYYWGRSYTLDFANETLHLK